MCCYYLKKKKSAMLRFTIAMPQLSYIIVVCVFLSLSHAQTTPALQDIYAVVAPAKMRPNVNYYVSMSLLDSPSPLTVAVQLFGNSSGTREYNLAKSISIQPKSTEIYEFDTTDWKPGNYTLRVKDTEGLHFDNSTSIEFEPKSYSVFIQTDRAVYKPGQHVHFRAIVVDTSVIPLGTHLINMFVTDADGNGIQYWRNVELKDGSTSAEFHLADRPVLGDWTVHVEILPGGQSSQKNFTVAEYILPTYEVHIDLPSYVIYNKSDVVVTVNAMFTFGKPVIGEVTLTVFPRTRYNKLTVRPYESYQTKTKIDGTVRIYMNLLHDLNLRTDFFKREIEFFAIVEEEITGHKYNTTNTMWIYDKDIKVDLIRTSDTFKRGLKYNAFLKVTNQDDVPVQDTINQLKLMYGYGLIESEWETQYHFVPRNGIIRIEFYPPRHDVTILSMRAEFRGQIHYLDKTDAAVSPSNNFIQATLITLNPTIGENVEIEVNATEPLTHIIYQVIGRGNVLLARTIPITSGLTVYRFNFRPPRNAAPRARVLVFYIRSNNKEVVADSIIFDVAGLFQVPVTVTTNLKQAEPGQSVAVTVKTLPRSLVGLLSMDQKSLQLKSGNDITKQDIIEELESYDGGKITKQQPPWYRRKKRSLSWTGSPSAGQVFYDSGVVFMTNSLLHTLRDEELYPEKVIYIDDKAPTAPLQPPTELPEAEPVSERIILRKDYPDTWLWLNTTAGGDGTAILTPTLPKSVTSWIITAFSVHPVKGVGISSSFAEVTAFRPFFITLSLPYAVNMGESLAIQVVVFSYSSSTIQAEVAIENRKKEFEFTSGIKDQGRRTKIVQIPPHDGTPVSFLITPQKIGYIDIKVSATSPLSRDSVNKKLLVKPEGSTQHFNKAFLLDFRSPGGSPFKVNISVPILRNAIEGSPKVTVSGTGDLLGPSVNSLARLLHMPTGCGEQNLLTFVPSLVIMRYLSELGRLSTESRNQAVRLLKSGYQRELTYKRDDGSFSTFGSRDKSGSTWLTAYVSKSFHQARSYIDIDENVINIALQWLIQNQNADGSFNEPGEVHHKALQGGSENGATLTAYVLQCLLENRGHHNYTREMDLAQQYLEREIGSVVEPYSVAVVAYTLHLVDSPVRNLAFQKLVGLANKSETEETTHWKNNDVVTNTTDKQSDYFFLAPSVDVETTAYGLLTYAMRGDVSGGFPVFRWLINQQNENGGFSSTQDTVVALQALAKMAPLLRSPNLDINANFNYGGEGSMGLRITSGNSASVQKLTLPPSTRYVEVEASGSGIAIVQISWSFNIAVSGEAPAFYLNALLDKTSTASYLQLSICTHQVTQEEPTNMAVMEVGLPSGYIADVESLPSILQIPKVKRVEALQEDTTVVIYFDRLNREESCVTVPAHRTHKVAHQRRAPVRVYDYYNQTQSSRMFYRPHNTTLCDICEENDCNEDCVKKTDPEAQINNDASISLYGAWMLLFSSSVFLIVDNLTQISNS